MLAWDSKWQNLFLELRKYATSDISLLMRDVVIYKQSSHTRQQFNWSPLFNFSMIVKNVAMFDKILQIILLSKNVQDTSHKLYMWHDILVGNLNLISILWCA